MIIYRVLESETYIFNLTAANLAGENSQPSWYKLYTATQVISIQPSWYKLYAATQVISIIANPPGTSSTPLLRLFVITQ